MSKKLTKTTIISLCLLIPLIVLAGYKPLYDKQEFSLYQNPEGTWIFLTPIYDYFAVWLGEDLGAMWIDRETMVSTCLIIREGKEKDCSIQEFSILMSKFPREIIRDLRI